MLKTLSLAAICFLALAPPKAHAHQNRHHLHYRHFSHHHFGHYLAQRFYRRHHHVQFAHRRMHRAPVHRDALTTAQIAGGQRITVASSFAERFVGFFAEIAAQFGRLPEVGCFAPHGHMPNSLHHWGGACDVGQTARNVAWRAMYHVTQIAHRWGLTDGCEWRRSPDCGHVEVNRAVATVPAVVALIASRRPRTYQIAGGWPL